MRSNVGSVDQATRVLAGLCLLGLYFMVGGWLGLLGLVGLYPLLTGIVGYCPLYALRGRSTRRP